MISETNHSLAWSFVLSTQKSVRRSTSTSGRCQAERGKARSRAVAKSTALTTWPLFPALSLNRIGLWSKFLISWSRFPQWWNEGKNGLRTYLLAWAKLVTGRGHWVGEGTAASCASGEKYWTEASPSLGTGGSARAAATPPRGSLVLWKLFPFLLSYCASQYFYFIIS